MNLKKEIAKFIAISLFIFTLATGVSYAQILTGSIRGTVSDEEGRPLPGVTVELSSPVLLGGVHSRITSEKGVYRFPNLPPGTYKLVLKVQGFQTIERPDIQVVVKGTMTLDVTMKIGILEESIIVIGQAPIIDVTSSGTSITFNKDFIEKLPVARNSIIDIAALSVGVSSGGGYAGGTNISAFGSNVESNSFQIDGLDATSSAFGYALITPNQEIFSEVEISGIGQPAEYGNFSGAVINTVTKSGGNAFSGTLAYYGQFQALTDDNNPDLDEYYSYHRNKYLDAVFNLGGPILKDRLWFFASVNIRNDDATGWNVDPKYHVQRTDNNYMFKLSFQIAQNHKLVGGFTYNYYDSPGRATQWRTPSTVRGFQRKPLPWNGWYTWVINKNAYFELKSSGYNFFELGAGSEGKAGFSEPVHRDGLTGMGWGGVSWPALTDYSRLQVSAKVSYFAENFIAGDHEFKIGVQYTRAKDIWAGSYSGGKYYYDWGGEPYLLYTLEPSHYGGLNENLGVFFDDSWLLGNRLSINLGLRFDNMRGSIPPMPYMQGWEDLPEEHPGIKNMLVWRLLSPRIGFAYTLTSDKKTILKAHYGRYYDNMFSGNYEWAGPLGNDFYAYEWDGNEWVLFNLVSETWAVPQGLKNPVSDSFSISLVRELFPDFSIEIMGAYKEWRNEVAQLNTAGIYELVPMVSQDNGKTYMIYNQINVGNNAYITANYEDHGHNYKGISLILKKRYSRNWMLNSSLTWSRSYGLNAISSTNSSSQMNVQNMSVWNQGKDPNHWVNARGLMNMDRTWVFKLQFGFNFPWDIFLSLNYQAMTGRAYVEQVRVQPDQGRIRIFDEPRSNKLRHNPVKMLDFRVEKTLTLYRNVRLSVLADVFNLLNDNTITGFRSYSVYSTVFRQPSSMPAPRLLQIGLKLQF